MNTTRSASTVFAASIALLGACVPSPGDEPDTDTSPEASSTSTGDGTSGGSEVMTTAGPGTGPDATDDSGETTGQDSTTTDAPETDTDAPECGDGHVDPGEACDDGVLDNADDQACLPDCQLASCGDGLVWADVEDCDLGADNDGAYGGCNPDCTFAPRCGDGVVDDEEGELCDGLSPDGIQCKACLLYEGAKLVFLTSASFTGDLGGLAGADALCSALADDAGLIPPPEDGEQPLAAPYRAWLSASEGSVDSRFAKHGLPYITRTGEVIAWSWDELTDPAVLKPQITQTELADVNMPAQRSWTNTRGDGTLASPTLHCGDWTLGDANLQGRVGTTSVDLDQPITPELIEAWTHLAGPVGVFACDYAYHLYCVEQ